MIVCFPLLVLSLTVTVADREPVFVGVNVIVTRQVFRGLIVPEFGHPPLVARAKSPGSVPPRTMLVMSRATVALVSVSVED